MTERLTAGAALIARLAELGVDCILANAATGAINARADIIPMLLFSGRTPTLEAVRFVPIGWGQEMFEQTALVRELCKWDYELRFAEQVHDVADRAFAIAHSVPRGPPTSPAQPICWRGRKTGDPCPTRGRGRCRL